MSMAERPRSVIDEPRAPQYPLCFADAGQPSADWRPSANAWADDAAGATPRSNCGNARRPRLRPGRSPQRYAVLLSRGVAGPQSRWSGRSHQTAVAAALLGLDPKFRTAMGHGAGVGAGSGPGSARQAFRYRQPGVYIPWLLQ